MAETPAFDYYYGSESEQFAFFGIPRQLVTGEHFRRVSTDAKLLYGLLLDRMGLSAKNRWYDEQGRVFIYLHPCLLSSGSLTGTRQQSPWWTPISSAKTSLLWRKHAPMR